MLAGVSVDYYTRLEQGRERNPSPAVLNALAGALALDTDLREHLFRLAGLAPTPPTPVRKTVDDSLRELLSSWSHTPALIIDRRLDVLAYNELAGALYSGFERIDNLVRMTFLDPFGRRFFTDWERATTSCVANLRLALGHTGSVDDVRASFSRCTMRARSSANCGIGTMCGAKHTRPRSSGILPSAISSSNTTHSTFAAHLDIS